MTQLTFSEAGFHHKKRKKRKFGYSKVRYKGIAKNRDRLCLLAGFYNPKNLS